MYVYSSNNIVYSCWLNANVHFTQSFAVSMALSHEYAHYRQKNDLEKEEAQKKQRMIADKSI